MYQHQLQVSEFYIYNIINRNLMLKFLDDRTHQKQKKSPIKYKPQMIYGISVQAPANFQTPYTIIHNQTYLNPFLQFERKREQKLPRQKTMLIKPVWTKKTNLQLVQEQKIIASNMEDPRSSPLSRYRKSYVQQFNQSQNRFKITRGQFTDFIQKNNRYRSMGPIHGKQRTGQRIQNTKKSVWLKPDLTCSSRTSKMLYSTYFDMMRQTSLKQGSLLSRNESSISSNSKLISEKTRIRDNRQKMNVSFQKNLQDRKHTCNFRQQLPKLHSEILGTYQPHKIRIQQQHKKDAQFEAIQQFEARLRRKFK